MYFPEELKLNKFVAVEIPENHTYFSRFGYVSVPDSQYSGDADINTNLNKTEVIELMNRRDREMLNSESKSE